MLLLPWTDKIRNLWLAPFSNGQALQGFPFPGIPLCPSSILPLTQRSGKRENQNSPESQCKCLHLPVCASTLQVTDHLSDCPPAAPGKHYAQGFKPWELVRISVYLFIYILCRRARLSWVGFLPTTTSLCMQIVITIQFHTLPADFCETRCYLLQSSSQYDVKPWHTHYQQRHWREVQFN